MSPSPNACVLWSCPPTDCISVYPTAQCNRCFSLWWNVEVHISSSSLLNAHTCPPIPYSLHCQVTLYHHQIQAWCLVLFRCCFCQHFLQPLHFQNTNCSKLLFDHRVWYLKGSAFHCAIQLYTSSSQSKFMLKCWSHFWWKLGLDNNLYFSSPPTAAAFLFHQTL